MASENLVITKFIQNDWPSNECKFINSIKHIKINHIPHLKLNVIQINNNIVKYT